MVDALVALGSNLGDRRETLACALKLLDKQPGVRVAAVSRWFATTPVGGPVGQGEFLNGVARLDTNLEPLALVSALHVVEDRLGRVRNERWAPRTLDLDLLLFGDQVIDTPELVVPHPRMAFRRFVLEPAAEIAGEMIHPQIGWSLSEIVTHLDRAANYVAIGGAPGAGQTWLAAKLQAELCGPLVRAPSWPEVLALSPATGQRGPAALRWLHNAAERLKAVDWPAAKNLSAPPVVSDFWLEQWPAEVEVWLAPADAQTDDDEWSRLASSVIRPRLVVVLDAPTDALWAELDDRPGGDALPITREQLNQSRATIRQLVGRGGHGPVLWLDSRDRASALAETLAAIAAMRPLDAEAAYRTDTENRS